MNDESYSKDDRNTASLYFKFDFSDLWCVDFSYWIDSNDIQRIRISHYSQIAVADFGYWNKEKVNVHIYPCTRLGTMDEHNRHYFYRAVQFIKSFTGLFLNFTAGIDPYNVVKSTFEKSTQDKPMNTLYTYFIQLYNSHYKYPYNYAVKEAIYTICAIYKFRNSALPIQKHVFHLIVRMVWDSRYDRIWKKTAKDMRLNLKNNSK